MIRPGEIRIDEVSRRFRVYPKDARTLKELSSRVVAGAARTSGRSRDVGLAVEPGEAVGLVGRNGSGKTTLLKLIGGIIKPSIGRVEVGGRVASLLELGAGFHPEFTGRENVFLNGALHGLSRAEIRERMDEIVEFAGIGHYVDLPVRTYSAGMYMRLGFAVAAHVDADVLLLDEIFAVGDEEFQRKCFGRISQFKQRGGTIVFVSHDAASVERLCERAVLLRDGLVDFDGPTHEAILRYRSHLAEDRDPAERGAGLTEWGSGEARITEVSLQGADGEERMQFVAGEQLTVRLRVVSDSSVPPPQLQFELREWGGALIAGGSHDTSRSAGTAQASRCSASTWTSCRSPRGASSSGSGSSRPTACTVPLARRRAAALRDPAGARRRARQARRALDEGGDRRARRTPLPMSSRTCPDWPRLMELAPELQFKHYTLAEAKLPSEASSTSATSRGHGRDLLRPRAPRLLRRAHRPRRRRRAAGDALVRPGGVVNVRPGPNGPLLIQPSPHPWVGNGVSTRLPALTVPPNSCRVVPTRAGS